MIDKFLFCKRKVLDRTGLLGRGREEERERKRREEERKRGREEG